MKKAWRGGEMKKLKGATISTAKAQLCNHEELPAWLHLAGETRRLGSSMAYLFINQCVKENNEEISINENTGVA
jgi:hypothetical protein